MSGIDSGKSMDTLPCRSESSGCPLSDRQYVAIDLKSFYASVECAERHLDPLRTNLVVADVSRTEKTICLAVSPSLKAYGIPGRARLFEVVAAVDKINRQRLENSNLRRFKGSSCDANILEKHKEYALDYIAAPPRMALYERYSSRIFSLYLKFVSAEDVHVYSVDEVFIDVTPYLKTYGMTARELAMCMIKEVLRETGITATAGIGSNMYLAKIAMDVVAKHMDADKDGVRIASLDEMSYRKLLWNYRPLTDFWRIGRGTAKRLAGLHLYTQGDIARCSLVNEDLLYDAFGVNAELLIDHAWGWEPCTMRDIKSYRSKSRSFSTSQVLSRPYSYDKALLVLREMSETMVINLNENGFAANHIGLVVNYDIENINADFHGETCVDYYGRVVPEPVNAAKRLDSYTSSSKKITEAYAELFEKNATRGYTVRRLAITLDNLVPAGSVAVPEEDLFSFAESGLSAEKGERERKMQEARLGIIRKYGKNALMKACSLEEGATFRQRNNIIGGHKA